MYYYNRYCQTLWILVLLDFMYITYMKGYFERQVKEVQGSSIQLNLVAAIVCYLSLSFGLYYFIIREKKGLADAFLLGLVIYSTYELTTLSLFKNWSIKTVIIDSLWGAILFTLTTAIVYRLY